MFLDRNQQLLVYIIDKKYVRKSKFVNIIQIRFFLLNKKVELIIFMPTNFVINGIHKSTIHTTFEVNSRVRKNY